MNHSYFIKNLVQKTDKSIEASQKIMKEQAFQKVSKDSRNSCFKTKNS